MKIYLVDLESVESRYTGEWKTYVPKLLRDNGFDVTVIEGPTDIPPATSPGAFLNFGGTNIYKADQLMQISRLFCDNVIKPGDHFLFTDAWNPSIINLKYMSELLNIPVTIHALFHAGNYDENDFLGRLIGNAPWIHYAEKAFYHAIDYNYFATEAHVRIFFDNLINDGYKNENPWYDEDWAERYDSGKIMLTGWPMDYMVDTLAPYKNLPKRDLILFPHRIAPEKQVDIFRDLALQLPQYEFIVCQDTQLSKHEYHTLLGQAKMVFSAAKQETLGIVGFEGSIVGAIPMVPDRVSYTEMYEPIFKYPSEWTENWEQYIIHRNSIVSTIVNHMENYATRMPILEKQSTSLLTNFFTATKLIDNLKRLS